MTALLPAPPVTDAAVALLDAAVAGLIDTIEARCVIAALADPRYGRRHDAIMLLMRAEDWQTADAAAHGPTPVGTLLTVLEALLPGVPAGRWADDWQDGCRRATELADLDAAGPDGIDRYLDGPVTDRRGVYDAIREDVLVELDRAARAMAGRVAA